MSVSNSFFFVHTELSRPHRCSLVLSPRQLFLQKSKKRQRKRQEQRSIGCSKRGAKNITTWSGLRLRRTPAKKTTKRARIAKTDIACGTSHTEPARWLVPCALAQLTDRFPYVWVRQGVPCSDCAWRQIFLVCHWWLVVFSGSRVLSPRKISLRALGVTNTPTAFRGKKGGTVLSFIIFF